MNNDRCIAALNPLAPCLAVTAIPYASHKDSLPSEWDFRLGYRCVSYYEVSVESMTPQRRKCFRLPVGFAPCISIGLCTSGLSRADLNTAQAGWGRESWGWHSDDGHLFHGSGGGVPYSYATPRAPQGTEDGGLAFVRHLQTGRVTFGEGDTVGCGVIHLDKLVGLVNQELIETSDHLPREVQGWSGQMVVQGGDDPDSQKSGIFFTKNGEFLGVAFILGKSSPQPQLWPLVGIDAPWVVHMNFGGQPFAFDVDSLFQPIAVRAGLFDTFQRWPAEQGDGGEVQGRRRMLPHRSCFAPRQVLGLWAREPAVEIAARYAALAHRTRRLRIARRDMMNAAARNIPADVIVLDSSSSSSSDTDELASDGQAQEAESADELTSESPPDEETYETDGSEEYSEHEADDGEP